MKNRGKIKATTMVYIVIIVFLILFARALYCRYNFYDYTKGIREAGRTSFTRDSKTVYSDEDSYKIENKSFNDAMFYKKIKVIPNTAYKVSCMVKTENVENMDGKYTGGAQIAINGTTETSEAITGTNDWQEITLMFNSNSRETVEIGFRLGGYEEYSKGTAWFSDIKLEEGQVDTNKNWHIACFTINNIDANVEGFGKVELELSSRDIATIRTNMRRLQEIIPEMSNGKMTITYDMIQISEPLTSISYDENNEYYVDPNDINELISDYIDDTEYDYIYAAVRLGDLNKSENVLVHDWIGLRFYGI